MALNNSEGNTVNGDVKVYVDGVRKISASLPISPLISASVQGQ